MNSLNRVTFYFEKEIPRMYTRLKKKKKRDVKGKHKMREHMKSICQLTSSRQIFV